MKSKFDSSSYHPFLVAFAATLVRYYDYALFGLSASVISETFMPELSNSDGLLGFFAILAITVIAKPLGSIIFGKIGDTVGRIESIKIATILAALSTSGVALIPGYHKIGVISVVLLIFCRMLFLMSFAGEVDAIKIYITEKVGKKNRYLASGLMSFSAQTGVLIAAGMYQFAMNTESIDNLWRLNFLIGGFLGLVVILLRKSLKESEIFIRSKSELVKMDGGIIFLIKTHKVKFILSVLISGSLGGVYHFLIIFLGTFAAKIALVITEETAQQNNVFLIALYSVACVISGLTADLFGKITKQIFIALIISVACIFIMQLLILQGIFAVFLHFLLVFCAPFYIIPIHIRLQSLFYTGVRMRMYSLSHSLGSMLFSSTTPFFCMILWKYTGMFFVVLLFYGILLGIILFCIAYLVNKKYVNLLEV
jgi:MFS family permease